MSHRAPETTPAGAGSSEAAAPPSADLDGPRLEVDRTRLFEDWRSARARAEEYLTDLGVLEPERARLAERAVVLAARGDVPSPGDAYSDTLSALRRLLIEAYPRPLDEPHAGEPDAFVGWRIASVLSGRLDGDAAACRPLPNGQRRLYSMPSVTRTSFTAHRFVRSGLRRAITRSAGEEPEVRPPELPASPQTRWRFAALRRRLLLAFLVLIPTVIAAAFMVTVLPEQGQNALELAIACCFGGLFGWISIGFWTATLGFLLLLSRRDRFAITRLPADGEDGSSGAIDPSARTAIVMPICEEPVGRVFAGLRAIHRSLAKTGVLEHFDFFVLSDTKNPSTTVDEEAAWFAWCRDVDGFGRIFYRRRRVRVERKSGNVADFCRRWGRQYRYMVMLDADSVMSGTAIAKLVRMMERNPGVGMIQTAPVAVMRRSLFARVQQFASRLYGPIFAAGLHYWQLGEGQYWGHNTIIRVEPFMTCCHLPRLPGKPPLGGEILSHDFVEAALMGRAGWTLWLAYDLPGSYEEVPSTLLEEMARDRRWCQGNIQHLRLLFTEGLRGAHRALFLNGVLSYVSAGLWFCFLALSTAEAIWQAMREPVYFPLGRSLFPVWPVWRPEWALVLAGVTATILFLPKLLSILLVVLRGEARGFGGSPRLVASALLEVLVSTLLAPVRMVFHSRFVLSNLTGRTVSWRSQTRGDSETDWGEAVRRHGFDTLWASAWAVGVFALNPTYFWWLTPIVVALVLSIPVSVLTSGVQLGERTRRAGLFLTPEETSPPPEIEEVERETAASEARVAALSPVEQDGFVRAVVDPVVNAVHCALLGGTRGGTSQLRAARRQLVARALSEGPEALGPGDRRVLLADVEPMIELHRRVWEVADRDLAARWGLAVAR
jgi:membrane glycosyltransferase